MVLLSYNMYHLCAILPVRLVRVPSCVQVESSPELNTTRYNHFLAAWKDQLLAVAGQVDDANGKSDKVLNVVALDLNTRTWSQIKKFATPNDNGPGERDTTFCKGGCCIC
jgi:hypothetical protein